MARIHSQKELYTLYRHGYLENVFCVEPCAAEWVLAGYVVLLFKSNFYSKLSCYENPWLSWDQKKRTTDTKQIFVLTLIVYRRYDKLKDSCLARDKVLQLSRRQHALSRESDDLLKWVENRTAVVNSYDVQGDEDGGLDRVQDLQKKLDEFQKVSFFIKAPAFYFLFFFFFFFWFDVRKLLITPMQ